LEGWRRGEGGLLILRGHEREGAWLLREGRMVMMKLLVRLLI
jgi:hypothetical protein